MSIVRPFEVLQVASIQTFVLDNRTTTIYQYKKAAQQVQRQLAFQRILQQKNISLYFASERHLAVPIFQSDSSPLHKQIVFDLSV